MKLKLLTLVFTTFGVLALTQCKVKTPMPESSVDCKDLLWSNLSARCVNPVVMGIDMPHVKPKKSNQVCYVYMVDSLPTAEIFLPKSKAGLLMAPDGSEWKNSEWGYRLVLNSDSRYELYDSKNRLIYQSK